MMGWRFGVIVGVLSYISGGAIFDIITHFDDDDECDRDNDDVAFDDGDDDDDAVLGLLIDRLGDGEGDDERDDEKQV